jgi:hypothetical protein
MSCQSHNHINIALYVIYVSILSLTVYCDLLFEQNYLGYIRQLLAIEMQGGAASIYHFYLRCTWAARRDYGN